MKRAIGAVAGLAMVFAAGSACAQILHYGAVLKGPGGARGELSAILDTDNGKLDCTIDYSGITASGADLTGDAGDVDVTVDGKDNPIEAEVTLSKAQIAALGAGGYAFDLKGASGDIKGKIYRDDSRGG